MRIPVFDVAFHTIPTGRDRSEAVGKGTFGEANDRRFDLMTVDHRKYPDVTTIRPNDRLVLDDARMFAVISVEQVNPVYTAITMEPA